MIPENLELLEMIVRFEYELRDMEDRFSALNDMLWSIKRMLNISGEELKKMEKQVFK